MATISGVPSPSRSPRATPPELSMGGSLIEASVVIEAEVDGLPLREDVVHVVPADLALDHQAVVVAAGKG